MDDRRHSQVVHLAKAVSVHDQREQVTDRCPPDTPIPTSGYNFCPGGRTLKLPSTTLES